MEVYVVFVSYVLLEPPSRSSCDTALELLRAVLVDMPGLSERDAPLGASVSTLGVETNTVPPLPDERAEVLEHRARVLEMLDRLQEHDRVSRLGERFDQLAREAQVRAAVAQPRMLVCLGVGIDADHFCGAARASTSEP